VPELPEVETVRRDLDGRLRAHRVMVVKWLDPRMVRGRTGAEAIVTRLAGQTTRGVGRRGKFLLWRFQSGDCLILHLGMSGRIQAGVSPGEARVPHTHLVVRLDDGTELRLSDPRRFGRVEMVPRGQRQPLALGPEPLSRTFTANRLQTLLAGRRAPVKGLLLDQRILAGVGNIYADEALFQAGIHPARPGGSLLPREVGRLHRALRRVLRAGLLHRGTTFRSFQDGFGEPGGHAPHLKAYGRRGEPCRRCGTAMSSSVVAGRTSYFCPACQPSPAKFEPEGEEDRATL
jgi:formamidopyrimidine-DNA glycosylase